MTPEQQPVRADRGARADGPRVVIAGAGLMGRWHAHSAARAGGRVVGICDTNLEAARALAAQLKTRCAENELQTVLAQVAPDVVHVCTPLESHAELCERALRAAADVIVEKPLAASAQETQRLWQLATEQGRIICPVHQLVFQPWLGLHERTGEILSIDYSACSAGAVHGSAGDADRVANEILPHPLSLFERLLASAAGRTGPPALPHADLGALQWHAERPAPGELRAYASANSVALSIGISMRGRPPRHELRVTGSRGTLNADLFHGFAWREGDTTSRAYKIARPFFLGARQVGNAAANLARRAARVEPAYPGLRELIGRVYEARASSAERDTATASPLSRDHTLAVARARDAILDAS